MGNLIFNSKNLYITILLNLHKQLRESRDDSFGQ